MSKTKSEFEYIINTSPIILFNCLTTASGLSEWFCDDVNLKDDKFTFFWDGSEETATLKNVKKGESIKFQWEDDEGEDDGISTPFEPIKCNTFITECNFGLPADRKSVV